jgi:aspartate 1-decarboxylase
VALNGAAALKGAPGDIIIVATFSHMDESEALTYVPVVVHVDARNRRRSAPHVSGEPIEKTNAMID